MKSLFNKNISLDMTNQTLSCETDFSPELISGYCDAKTSADEVLNNLIKVTAPCVKGAHDAGMVVVRDRAFIVYEANDTQPGEAPSWPFVYAAMSVVNIKTLEIDIIPFARSEQRFSNHTLPVGACFVPRVIQKDEQTLRCFFSSENPGKRQSQIWFRDFNINEMTFSDNIEKMKIKTAKGVFDMQPRYLHEDAVAQGFKREIEDCGLYIFDAFKTFNDVTYTVLNNFRCGQNSLAILNKKMDTLEVIGHYNEPYAVKLTESAVNQLPDGTWMAICRQDGGNNNYTFSTSLDGINWNPNKHWNIIPNGINSKPTFDRFGNVYYLGWQEATKINGKYRSVFNIDVSSDCISWKRKYRFETDQSFQYPFFIDFENSIYLAVTQGNKERIMFGKLETKSK